jgi:aquaporin Z
MAGVAVGSVIALEALFAGPVCGASMNPARSLAPAVVSGYLGHLWVYLTAPVLGAGLAVPGLPVCPRAALLPHPQRGAFFN